MHVIVHEAKDLHTTDTGGNSDSYVVVKLGTEEYRSRTAWKTLQPQWNQRFKMYLYKVC